MTFFVAKMSAATVTYGNTLMKPTCVLVAYRTPIVQNVDPAAVPNVEGRNVAHPACGKTFTQCCTTY